MTTATYRGVKYNTAEPQKAAESWAESVVKTPGIRLVYRGKCYQPKRNA